jgi:hypothetical protein
MKIRLFALLLALSVSTWAQTAAQGVPAQSTPSTPKSQCACCDKAAKEDGAGCCQHAKGKDDKEVASCCGKEGSSCCGKGMQCGKESAKDGGCCGDGKSCCGKSAEGDKTAMKCCKEKQCERHHATEHPSPGN